jgi:glutathione-regulated potassium-efflux system ancillary protein KefC
MDSIWLLIALVFGLAAQQFRLPPLVGFLLAGFALHGLGKEGGELLELASNAGVLLLLFTIGLKLRLSSFLSPPVWGGGTFQMLITWVSITAILLLLGVAWFGVLDQQTAMLMAFACSFSSTVLAVKIFEDRGEMRARHALIAVGILVIQDVMAVIFLLAVDGTPPSIWALGLLLLPVVRPALLRLMAHAGHGEMLVLFGFTTALAGAELFEVVGMKDGLGALVFGIMLSGHPKSMELTRSLLGFKDFLLIGFFLSIGLIGFPSVNDLLIVALLVVLLLPLKMAVYFLLLTRFRLRARTAFLAMLGLATFSEFGLIVTKEGVIAGLIGEQWLVTVAIAVAISFTLASVLNVRAHELYARFEGLLCRFEVKRRLPEDLPPDIGTAEVLIMGMGRVGRGAYRAMTETYASKVCGADVDGENVAALRQINYNVICGDAEDIDFWRHIACGQLRLVMLALPTQDDMLLAVKLLKAVGYHGKIGAVTKYDDHRVELEEEGVDAAFNFYTEAGTGFADHVQSELTKP